MGYRMIRQWVRAALGLGLFLSVIVAGPLAIGQGYTPHGICVANNWVSGYGSMTTSSDCSQPGFANLSGTASSSQLSGSYTGITGVGTLAAGSLGAGFTPVPNSELANSAMTIGGKSVSLGGGYAPARSQSVPSAQAGNATTTTKMNGLAGSITPATSGNVLILLDSTAKNTTSGDGCNVQLAVGTGSAPANGASATGTTVGNLFNYINALTQTPMSLNGYVTGLTVGTAYWIDVQVSANSGGTCTLGPATIDALEQ